MLPATDHPDVALAEFVGQFRNDPLGFVLTCFEWGEGPLAHFDGPDEWQSKFLADLGRHLQSRNFDGRQPVRPIKMSVGSGRGIGKSALCAMLTCFLLSTRPNCKITITSNTFNQLSTKTWAECQVWIKRCITGHWFESTGERIYRIGEKEAWFAAAITCSEENSQSFAGQHSATSSSVYIFDEASTIPDIIAEVAISGMTTGEPMFFAFGNVTETSGFFYRSLFGADSAKYDHRSIDSRTCAFPNRETNDEAIEEYGEDSDYCRVWIRGLAPRASAAQYISDDLIKEAQTRVLTRQFGDEPLIAGVDFAWGGDDFNTVRFRRGLDARSIPPIRVAGERTRKPEYMVSVLSEVFTRDFGNGLKVSMMFMDSAGIAGPVAVRLRQLGFKDLVEVNFNAQSINPKYKNVRSQLYGQTKEWLIAGGCIDKSVELSDDLRIQEVLRHVPMVLKPKELLIKETGHSTDDGDGLGLTFYAPVVAKSVTQQRSRLPFNGSVSSAYS